jgi:hypothetical protein
VARSSKNCKASHLPHTVVISPKMWRRPRWLLSNSRHAKGITWFPHWFACVATLTWSSVGVKPNTWKSGDLESSGTPECLELDSKGQNTLHWGVLGVIGKVLKRRYLKWPRIGHLDICSPSYGQKKGRESNWQFDSRPLKVGNRPLPDVRFGVRHGVEKISTRATTLIQTSS